MAEHHVNVDDLSDEFLALLAVEGNGAVETALPSGVPLRVVVIGPIKTWWGRMDSVEYSVYSGWRDTVRAVLIREGCLVYSPHRAWSGAWHESAQRVNDAAIGESDLVINVGPVGVEAVGTDAEIAVAESHGIPVLRLPEAGAESVKLLVNYLRELQTSLG